MSGLRCSPQWSSSRAGRRRGGMPALLESRRRQVAQGRVTTFRVVVAEVFAQFLLRFGTSPEVLAVDALDLDRAVGRFHRRVATGFAPSPEGSRNSASLVFPAVALATHGNGNPARLQDLAIAVGSVLRTTIGVMHPARRRVAPAQGDPQCGQRQLLRQSRHPRFQFALWLSGRRLGRRLPLAHSAQFANVFADISDDRATAGMLRPPSVTCCTAAVRNSGVSLRFTFFLSTLHRVNLPSLVASASWVADQFAATTSRRDVFQARDPVADR